MKHRHTMPFGAELLDDRTTRFRLWAPGAPSVAIETHAATAQPNRFEMEPLAGGWFEKIIADAPAGERYSYRINGTRFSDPASRFNPDDVHGPSMVVDPLAFEWNDAGWRGRPWEEAVVYELHIGAFTPEGTFAAAEKRLDYLAKTGIAVLEIMPVADFPGRRNWGYDGVLPFAPDSTYGAPEDLKRLVQGAHSRGLMVLLDVVYNHFGPEGNYLNAYAPQFFNARQRTPWGAAINFDAEDSRTVRDFFIHNALYWIEEYRFDGLRMDAVHAIVDESQPDIIAELTQTVRAGPGRDRHVHLVLENDRNQSRYLVRDAAHQPLQATAQWNDDVHHAAHVLLTGERDGYYADYAGNALWHFGRALAEGFSFQGDHSPYRGGKPRGEPSRELPSLAFVPFLQTHDQVGNRALGDRLSSLADKEPLRAATACVLLAPAPPLIFMGEEFAASTPFQFFCDFSGELAGAVTRGRREEFASFKRFKDPAMQATIPDPGDPATFAASKLRWDEIDRPPHSEWLAFYRKLLSMRKRQIAPRLANMKSGGDFGIEDVSVLRVHWTLGDGSQLHLIANLGPAARAGVTMPAGDILYANIDRAAAARKFPAWTLTYTLQKK